MNKTESFINSHRKVYPEKMQQLRGQILTGCAMKLIASHLNIIKEYRKYHQKAYGGHVLARDEIAILMMEQGKEETLKDIEQFKLIIKEKKSS